MLNVIFIHQSTKSGILAQGCRHNQKTECKRRWVVITRRALLCQGTVRGRDDRQHLSLQVVVHCKPSSLINCNYSSKHARGGSISPSPGQGSCSKERAVVHHGPQTIELQLQLQLQDVAGGAGGAGGGDDPSYTSADLTQARDWLACRIKPPFGTAEQRQLKSMIAGLIRVDSSAHHEDGGGWIQANSPWKAHHRSGLLHSKGAPRSAPVQPADCRQALHPPAGALTSHRSTN